MAAELLLIEILDRNSFLKQAYYPRSTRLQPQAFGFLPND
jgi:hypothetical protein